MNNIPTLITGYLICGMLWATFNLMTPAGIEMIRQQRRTGAAVFGVMIVVFVWPIGVVAALAIRAGMWQRMRKLPKPPERAKSVIEEIKRRNRNRAAIPKAFSKEEFDKAMKDGLLSCGECGEKTMSPSHKCDPEKLRKWQKQIEENMRDLERRIEEDTRTNQDDPGSRD